VLNFSWEGVTDSLRLELQAQAQPAGLLEYHKSEPAEGLPRC
jgi:hypothetical protein